MSDAPLVTIELRPKVPMGAFQALGYVCVLGVVEALRGFGLDVGIGWPFDVVDVSTNKAVASLRVRGGYDGEMFASCEMMASRDDLLQLDERALAAYVNARVERWECDVLAGHAAAGPLAPVLSDYFDLVTLMGDAAKALYPNGRMLAAGTLAGIDAWGHALLILEGGQELPLSPEQVTIRPA